MIDIKQNSPLVSIPVITYNSAKTVLETLESIKAQTYPNIELIISDDCSTDNTVEICQIWLKQNIERFVRTELITVEKNTGVAENCNRVGKACRGEWVKGIAGDDLLMPDCIQDCMEYVAKYPDTIYLFGRCRAFGADEDRCREINDVFDYSIFSKSNEEQIHQLLFVQNCIPATTFCYNRDADAKIGIRNDERIPMIEDWPRWVNLLRAGVKFHFIDKVLVKYRVGGISTAKRMSLASYRSERLMRFYYQYPEWLKENEDKAIQRIIDEECTIYRMLLEAESDDQTELRYKRDEYKQQYEFYYKQYMQTKHSKAYRIGKILLKPFKIFKKK